MLIESMVKVYANLVVNRRRTIESLPEDYKQPVTDYIKANYPEYNLGA
jgi:hypothetical protein